MDHNRIPCSAASELGLHCLRMSVLWYAGLELVDEVNSGLDHMSLHGSAGSRLISYEDITRFNIFTMHSTLSTLTTYDISVFCLAFPTEWGSWACHAGRLQRWRLAWCVRGYSLESGDIADLSSAELTQRANYHP